MTTLNQARDAVYKRFLAEWVDEDDAALTPFTFDNEVFDPPKGTDGAGAPWVRCSMRSITGGQETLGVPGNRKYTRQGLARVEVYTIPGSGLKDADLLITTAMTLFEGRSLLGEGVRLYDAQSAEVGLVDEGRWFLSTVQASFDYEDVK